MIFVSTIESRRNVLSWVEAHTIAKKQASVAASRRSKSSSAISGRRTRRLSGPVDKKVRASVKTVKESMDPAHQIVSSIDRLVQDRVRVAIEKAIEALKNAM
jgi:hypothetical protein